MTVQVAAQRTGLGWIDGRLEEAGRHRVRARRRAAFSQVMARIRVPVRTMVTTVREYGWAVGAAGAFTGAGFTVSDTLGLVVTGLALFFLEWRTRE